MLNNHEFGLEPLETRLELVHCYWQRYLKIVRWVQIGFIRIGIPGLAWQHVCAY